jgi:thioredoxin family protein
MPTGRYAAVITVTAALAFMERGSMLARQAAASPGTRHSAASAHGDYAGWLAGAQSWPEFLASVTAQRERWVRNFDAVAIPTALVRRFHEASAGVELLIVTEDWCVDSVNTVPYIVGLAAAASVPVVILDGTSGKPIMDRHRTADGRIVTPTVVMLRDGREVGAWLERPEPLQRAFRSMAHDRALQNQFELRQSWYDTDHGRTTLNELLGLAERQARRR